MKHRWSSPILKKEAINTLHAAEARFPVSLLATSREALVCCRPDEIASEKAHSEAPADFDYLPVEDGNEIIGLFDRKATHSDVPIRTAMQPLNEGILIGADAAMLSFIENAHRRKFVFLVEKNRISGAVTLSDIQKIEARPLIFMRVTMFELLLNNWLRTNDQGPEAWLSHISNKQRDSIDFYFNKRHDAGEEIDLVTAASLPPKIAAGTAMGLFAEFPDRDEMFQAVINLRDQLAHALEYGATPSSASDVSKRIARLRDYIVHLESKTANDQTCP